MVLEIKWRKDEKKKKTIYFDFSMSLIKHDTDKLNDVDYENELREKIFTFWEHTEHDLGKELIVKKGATMKDVMFNPYTLAYEWTIPLKVEKKKDWKNDNWNYRESMVAKITRLVMSEWEYELEREMATEQQRLQKEKLQRLAEEKEQ